MAAEAAWRAARLASCDACSNGWAADEVYGRLNDEEFAQVGPLPALPPWLHGCQRQAPTPLALLPSQRSA